MVECPQDNSVSTTTYSFTACLHDLMRSLRIDDALQNEKLTGFPQINVLEKRGKFD